MHGNYLMAGARQNDCRGYTSKLGPLVNMIKKDPGNTPGIFFESCIAAVLEF